MIQTDKFRADELEKIALKVSNMPKIKRIPVRYDNKTTIWIKAGKSPEKAIQRIANREITGVKRIS